MDLRSFFCTWIFIILGPVTCVYYHIKKKGSLSFLSVFNWARDPSFSSPRNLLTFCWKTLGISPAPSKHCSMCAILINFGCFIRSTFVIPGGSKNIPPVFFFWVFCGCVWRNVLIVCREPRTWGENQWGLEGNSITSHAWKAGKRRPN